MKKRTKKLDCGIDIAELQRIENLEKMRNLAKYLLRSDNPSASIRVDGRAIKISGEKARIFGVGMQIVLGEIGYDANDDYPETKNHDPWSKV